MTEEAVLSVLNTPVIQGLGADIQKRVVCSLIGHSRIQTVCFGYFSCARCDAQVGDAIAGAYDATNVVIVGHDCEHCRQAAKQLTWKDTLLAPDPFNAEDIQKQRDAREALDRLRAGRYDLRSR